MYHQMACRGTRSKFYAMCTRPTLCFGCFCSLWLLIFGKFMLHALNSMLKSCLLRLCYVGSLNYKTNSSKPVFRERWKTGVSQEGWWVHQNCLGQEQRFNVHQLIVLEIEFQSGLLKPQVFEVSMPISPGKCEKPKRFGGVWVVTSQFSPVAQSCTCISI